MSEPFRGKIGLAGAPPSPVARGVIGMPFNTASTASLHNSHLPSHTNPAEPLIGFMIRPHASYNKDLKIAALKTHHHSCESSLINNYAKGFKFEGTRAEDVGAGVDEVDEAGTAVEFGEEDGGVGLGLRGVDPMKARP